MSVHVTTLEDLPAALQPQVAALDWLDNDPPFDVSVLREARAGGAPFSEYLALLAVENGQVLSRVGVQRPPLTTEDGTELFCGIDGVATRPDALRRGLAEKLLRLVHRRERARGHRWSLLWTHRTWGAHRLYEKLGYRDVYSPPSALRRIPANSARRPGRPYVLRTAAARDAGVLTSILRDSTAGRLGFLPRFHGYFRLRFRIGWRRPEDHHLLYRGARPVGYFLASQARGTVAVAEAMARTPEDLLPLLDAMDRLARGRWLAIGRTTFVQDTAPTLEERGFALYARGHTTLMARRLASAGVSDVAQLTRLVVDPRFSCHGGDMF